MRKMMFIAFAAATFMFASCHTGNNKNDNKQGTDDTTIVATEAEANADTTATEATDAEKAEAPAEDAPAEAAPAEDAPAK